MTDADNKKLKYEEFLKPTDTGYLREHERVTRVLFDLVGNAAFMELALRKQKKEKQTEKPEESVQPELAVVDKNIKQPKPVADSFVAKLGEEEPKQTDVKPWMEDGHQAAEDVAAHLLLMEDNPPTMAEAKQRVLAKYERNLNSPGRAANSAATRKH